MLGRGWLRGRRRTAGANNVEGLGRGSPVINVGSRSKSAIGVIFERGHWRPGRIALGCNAQLMLSASEKVPSLASIAALGGGP